MKLMSIRCIAVLAIGVGAANGQAAPASRSRASVEGKMAAPNLEDNADYFSVNRKDISPEDLKKADQIRLKTITSIEQLLKSKQKSTRRFELLLRLGELHVERHDFLRDGEMAVYEKAWDAWHAAAPAGKQGVEPKLNTTHSDQEMLEAANAFRELVNEFPRHPHTDAALYSLARVLARMGRDTAVDYYQQLIRAFPKSPLIPDTYLSLGEYYFDKHQIAESMAYYKKVMDFKDHRAYPYAVYKLGWAYYNAPAKNDAETKENYRKAVAAFKLVVKLADRGGEGSKNNMDLRHEALKDLVMVWADAEDVASAWKYFKSINEPAAFYKMLDRLGNIYADQGKNSQAIAVFRRLLQDAPNRDNNPAIHAKLLELYDLTNDIPAVVAGLKEMHQIYLGNTPWTQANRQDAAALAEGRRLCELHTHRYGALFHQRGQKAKSPEYLHHAANVYQLYLGAFAASKDAYDIRYYLAELLYDFKQYEPAAGHYLIVAKADPKGKYMKPAALNAVAAMNQAVQAVKWPAVPPPGQVPKPIALPHLKAKFIETIDQYVALLPHEKDGEPMRFTAAQILFELGHYPESLARFEKITQEIPTTLQAQNSVKIIMGYYAEREDWDQVIAKGQIFAKQEALLNGNKGEVRRFVTDLLRGSMFKRALAFEKAGQNDRAAASFVEFQKAFPQDANADRALYNAMLNYFKVGRTDLALGTAKHLLESYPKSVMVADVLANVGSTYEALAKFDEAAVAYKRLASTFPQDKRAPSALYNAAILYKGVGNTTESANLLRQFQRQYPDNAITADASLELARLLEKQNEMAETVQIYQGLAKKLPANSDQALLAAAKAATLKAFGADRKTGLRDLEKVKKALMGKDAPPAVEARAVVAEALFKLAEPPFGEYRAMAINDGSRIEQQVTEKQKKLEILAATYEQIIGLGSSEYTVAALYRLGEAHENFATQLFKAPGPKGASQADVDKFKTELEKVAFPLKQEAYKFFETAYKRSREVETFTAWTRRTYQKMVELAPEKHPDINEMSADPGYLSHDVKMTKPVAELMGVEE